MIETVKLIAEGGSEGPNFPTVADFLPESFALDGTWFAMNRLLLIRAIILLLILLFFGITLYRAKKRVAAGNHIPTKPQSVIEMLYDFIKKTVYENMPANVAKKWVPMALTIFTSVTLLDLTGIVPGLNLAGTAGIGVPLFFALWVFTAYWRVGIKTHGGGVKGFLVFVKAELFPPGIPVFVYPIYAILETLQLLLIRPASLALRLFANMVSGHMLVAMAIAATQFFIIVAGPALKAFGILTFAGSVFFICFEFLVAALQAYVFTLLMCVYISLSVGHESEHSAAGEEHAVSGANEADDEQLLEVGNESLTNVLHDVESDTEFMQSNKTVEKVVKAVA